ncbi:integrase [Corynebacterium auriscanis]|uniref:integrase n=1 Tax=Corynebacterium auriscanis TaxID=99807 RepID=UPI002246A213|nr:integrase [Corynebacterium auriscanis]MCX2163259.1 integrase [Corynebacterium auriscanis]
MSPTANQHDAIDAVELALADDEELFGHPMVDDRPIDEQTGEVLPVVTIVTNNEGPFRFEAFIELHPKPARVRTRVTSPGPNGSRERGLGTLTCERLFIDGIEDAVMLAERAEDCRIEYNQVRPHEAIAWNRPKQVHQGQADPNIPDFQNKKILPTP